MRNWLILSALLILTYGNAQEINLTSVLPKNQTIDCFNYGTDLFLTAGDVHYCAGPSYRVRYTYHLEVEGENPNCVYVSRPVDSKAWSCWYVQKDNRLKFYVIELDLNQGTKTEIDSFEMDNAYKLYHLSSQETQQGGSISYICKYDHSTKEITQITCNAQGKIVDTYTNNFRSNNSKMSRNDWIHDVSLVDDSLQVFSFIGSSSLLVADRQYMKEKITDLKFSGAPVSQNELRAYFPSFGGMSNGKLNYYDIALSRIGAKIRYPIYGQLNISSDTITLDQLLITPRRFEHTLVTSVGSSSKDSVHYCALNPLYGNVGSIAYFPSIIHVQKYKGDELLWTKDFTDGENFLRGAFIEKLDDDHFVLGGTVFNYEKSRELEGFYIILDADGSVLTSSLSLVEDHLQVFPNPTSDHLVVKNPGQEGNSFEYQIIHNSGQVVQSGYGTYGQNLSITNLRTGTYFLRMLGSEKVVPFVKR